MPIIKRDVHLTRPSQIVFIWQLVVIILRNYQRAPMSSTRDNFAKYAKRQEITRFLARHEFFMKIAGIQGCIIECGVYAVKD
jgi:hypothetical protein